MTIADEPLAAFRQETRAWLAENCPAEMRVPETEETACWGGRRFVFASAAQRLWLERMAARGWTAPDWPREYGGGGLGPAEARVLREEMRRIGARRPLDSLGLWMLGPALLEFGDEAQKRQHLPPIARGEIRWAQGYSEPGAGSDLAGLSMGCADRGDHWLVDGSKIWTSYGDQSDWIFCLVRTDREAPKHKGISFLLIDLDSPGVSTRPIKLISGEAPFTQTFFDQVKVPKRNLVGRLNAGWDIAKYLLRFERELIGTVASDAARDEGVAARARAALGADGLAAAPELRLEILRYELDAWVMDIALERSRDLARAGALGPVAASVLKLAGTRLNQRRTDLLVSIAGVDGLRFDDGATGETARRWLHSKADTISGGSSEIQLNIIARRALELPGDGY
jgi:alkylation response protein AidB-like acyl-CoA dehydrogenase